MPSTDFLCWAMARAREIVSREGAELALAARDLDEAAVEASATLLAAEIVKAMIEAHERGEAG